MTKTARRKRTKKPVVRDWVTDHGITHLKRRRYLKAFAKHGTHQAAAKAAGVHRRSHYGWLTDPAYARAFEEAKDEAADSLEQELIARARDGWREPVYQGGELVGHILKKSDTLLIFALKGLRPEKYREKFEHTGPRGGPIQLEPVIAKVESLTVEEIEHFRALAAKAQSTEPPK